MADLIDDVFKSGFSAGGAQRLTPTQFSLLVDYCIEKNTLIHTVEAFALDGGSEIAKLELGIYGPRRELKSLPWPSQVQMAADSARSMATGARELQVPVIFQVWLEAER